MKKLFLFASLFGTYYLAHGQESRSKVIRESVLKFNRIGEEYKFNTEDNSVTYLRYLGKVTTKKGETFKVLTSVWIWGLSKRATNNIFVYTGNDKYLGSYRLTMAYDIPVRIQDSKLVFINDKESDCDPKQVTFVDLSNGIPKEFFRRCKGGYGDIYTFSKDQ